MQEKKNSGRGTALKGKPKKIGGKKGDLKEV